MHRSFVLPVFVILCMPVASAQAQIQPNTQRGAAFGGIAGAIAGGLIGENNDKAGAGALIGGAIGAVTGGIVGNARDKELQSAQFQAQSRARYQYQQQQYAATAAIQQAVSMNDVISMSRSGLGDSVVINQIMQRGVQRRLEVSDIIQLHQNGVSEAVITSMQRANVGTPVVAAPVQIVEPAPVYIERQVEIVPTYVVPAPRYYHYPQPHYHRSHRGGF